MSNDSTPANRRRQGQPGIIIGQEDEEDGDPKEDDDDDSAVDDRPWGGARNRANRRTDTLGDGKIVELISAANFALATGRTFQRHWTVRYDRAGIAETDATRFIGKLLDLVGKHARRASGELSAIWAREIGSGYGGHVHILLHLPPGLLLRNLTRRWIKAAGGTCRQGQGVSVVKRIGGRLIKSHSFYSSQARARVDSQSSAESFWCSTRGRARICQTSNRQSVEQGPSEHLQAHAENVIGYLLKSASPETGERLGLKYHGRGGTVIGKRCGSTQNIGKAARLRHGQGIAASIAPVNLC